MISDSGNGLLPYMIREANFGFVWNKNFFWLSIEYEKNNKISPIIINLFDFIRGNFSIST